MSQPPPSPRGGRGSSRLVVCNHGTTDGEDEATGREAGGCPAPRTGSAERARRRCSSPCRPARGRSLVNCSHRASRIAHHRRREMRALRATAHLLHLLSRPHRQPLPAWWCCGPLGDRGVTAAPPGSARNRKWCKWQTAGRASPGSGTSAASASPSICEFEGRQTQQCGLQAMKGNPRGPLQSTTG